MKIYVACLGLILISEASGARVKRLKNNGAVCDRSEECKSHCCSVGHLCIPTQSATACIFNTTGQVSGGGQDAEEDANNYEGDGEGKGNAEDEGNRDIHYAHNNETVTLVDVNSVTSNTRCGCSSCTASVLGRVANGHRVKDRIDWLINTKGQSEKSACDTVCGKEFPNICGECSCAGAKCNGCSWDGGNSCPDWWCNESQSNCNVCTGT